MYSRGWAFIHEVYCRVRRFCPVPFWQVFLVHDGPSNLYYVPIFSLGHAVLLRCVTAGEFSSDSFLAEIGREHIREIFFPSILSKAAYVPACSLFSFGFELLEVSEHFTLLPHRVDPGVPGKIVNKRDIISASAECTYLGRSPYI